MTKDALIASQRAITHLAEKGEPATSKEMVDCINVIEKLMIISDRFKLEEQKERERNQNPRDVAAIDPFSSKGE